VLLEQRPVDTPVQSAGVHGPFELLHGVGVGVSHVGKQTRTKPASASLVRDKSDHWQVCQQLLSTKGGQSDGHAPADQRTECLAVSLRDPLCFADLINLDCF
jgi:hypothetical protein